MVMHRKMYFVRYKGTTIYDTDGIDAVVKHYNHNFLKQTDVPLRYSCMKQVSSLIF